MGNLLKFLFRPTIKRKVNMEVAQLITGIWLIYLETDIARLNSIPSWEDPLLN